MTAWAHLYPIKYCITSPQNNHDNAQFFTNHTQEGWKTRLWYTSSVKSTRCTGIFDRQRNPSLFEFFNVKPRAGYRILEPDASSRTFHHAVEVETRGRKEKLHAIKYGRFIRVGSERIVMAAPEVGADVEGRTIHSVMRDALDYNKYLACVKGWLPDRAKEQRVEWATVMFNRYSQPEDWYRVRFSDEVHFGYGLEGQLRIIRKPGTRKRPDCIQHRPPLPKEDKDRKRTHC